MRSMFDAIAPRYDLVNRIMTFRMDVGWRRRDRARARPGRRELVLDLACGTGDLCRELAAAGLRPIWRRPVASGCCAAARTRRAARPGRHPPPARPDGSVDGVDVRVRPAQPRRPRAFFAELGRVVRPRWADRPARRRDPAQRLVRWGHGIYFGKVVPRIGGWLSDPAAYRYLPRRVAYLPPPADMLTSCGGQGSPTPPTPSSAAASPSCSAAPPTTADACRHPSSPTTPPRRSTSATSPGVTATCSCATASVSAGRGVAARAFNGTRVPALLASIEHDDRTRRRRGASPRSPSAGCRTTRRRRARLIVPAVTKSARRPTVAGSSPVVDDRNVE